MTWWMWLLFWAIFWVTAFAYLAWRCWRVWPHARDFARTTCEAWSRLDEARSLAEQRSAAETSAALVPQGVDDLAWNKPASHWRRERQRARERQRDLRLDSQAEVWSSWRDPLE